MLTSAQEFGRHGSTPIVHFHVRDLVSGPQCRDPSALWRHCFGGYMVHPSHLSGGAWDRPVFPRPLSSSCTAGCCCRRRSPFPGPCLAPEGSGLWVPLCQTSVPQASEPAAHKRSSHGTPPGYESPPGSHPNEWGTPGPTASLGHSQSTGQGRDDPFTTAVCAHCPVPGSAPRGSVAGVCPPPPQ